MLRADQQPSSSIPHLKPLPQLFARNCQHCHHCRPRFRLESAGDGCNSPTLHLAAIMTAVAHSPAFQPTLDTPGQIPIASLSPSSLDDSSHILALVVLVWPYSSSTETLALLLADPDIRKRKSKGQVKVVFRHGCAREVARTKVGIGDVVKLGLDGCEWTETGEAVSTPGKKIEWDLEYRRRVVLQILRGGEFQSGVNYTANESTATITNGTNGVVNGTYSPRPLLNGVNHRTPSTIQVPYLTPQKSLRTAGRPTFVDVAFDLAAEDDGYVPGQGRKRTKFARNSGAWSFVDTEEEVKEATVQLSDGQEIEQQPTPRSEETDLTVARADDAALSEDNVERAGDAVLDGISRASHGPIHAKPVDMLSPTRITDHRSSPLASPTAVMGPPLTPRKALRLQLGNSDVDGLQESPRSDATTTPRILPIPSPGLPLVSPLIQRTGAEVCYFPLFTPDLSELASSSTGSPANFAASPNLEVVTESPISEDVPISEGLSGSLQTPASGTETEATKLSEHAEITKVISATNGATGNFGHEEAQLSLLTGTPSIQDYNSSPDSAPATGKPQAVTQVIEIEEEDEDMYGASSEVTKLNTTNNVLPPTTEPLLSPLDVLEQFLRMSPVSTADTFTVPESYEARTLRSASLQQITVDMADGSSQRAQTPGLAAQKRSPIAYPELQSPFLQNRDHPSISSSSSRRSSNYHSRIQSLDGIGHEQGPFAEYISHLSHLSAIATNAPQFTAGQILPTNAPDQILPTNEPDNGLSVCTELPAQTTHATELLPVVPNHGVAEKVPEQPNEAAVFEPTQETTGLGNRLNRKSSDTDHDELSQLQEIQLQLLTPDLSQMQHFSPEPQREPIVEQAAAENTLPSPQYTQEVDENVNSREAHPSDIRVIGERPTTALSARNEGTMMGIFGKRFPQIWENETPEVQQEESETATQEPPLQAVVQQELPEESMTEKAVLSMAPDDLNVQTDTTTPRRISQRLSARKSVMANNVSSPYFTPRKAHREASSSPTRKENIRFPTPERVSLQSSPILENSNAPALDASSYSANLNSVSPSLGSKRPVSRRHTGLVTPLAYYAHLSSLHEHFGQLVDILAVCTESSPTPERAKLGPKDYHTTLRVADPSLASGEGTSATTVQIFRHVKNTLPSVSGGDTVILRNFKVQTSSRKFMLLSAETSSWAVFRGKSESATGDSDVVVSGPPIEYGPGEISRVKVLFRWWDSGGQKLFSPGKDAHNQEYPVRSSPELRSRSPIRKDFAKANPKPLPANSRRKGNMTDNVDSSNAVENFFASFANSDHVDAADTSVEEDVSSLVINQGPQPRLETNMTDHTASAVENIRQSPRASTRRKNNQTDNIGNEGSSDTEIIDDHDSRENSAPPLSDTTKHRNRRQSTISLTAASESGPTSFTPRRSARQSEKRRAKSPIVVHELRDGTKYVDGDDERRRSGSVVHELRDGLTYVDE